MIQKWMYQFYYNIIVNKMKEKTLTPKISPQLKQYMFKDKQVSPTRYRGIARIFQLNLSKILNNYNNFQHFDKQYGQNGDLIVITNKHPIKEQTPSKKLGRLKGHNKPLLVKPDLQPISKRRQNYNQRITSYAERNIQGSTSNKNVSDKKTHNFISRDSCSKNKTTIETNNPQRRNNISKIKFQHSLDSPKKINLLKQENFVQKRLLKPVCLISKNPQELKDIKSQSFAIYEHETNRLVYTHRGNGSYQIASLTKIMTFYTAMKIAKDNNIDISNCKLIVEDHIMEISGTSAELLGGQQYTIQQLFYGLMLPSGNDAATCLAQWGGQFFTEDTNHEIKIKAFIQEMNKNAKNLDLIGTRFANPHGLPHFESKSTAVQVAKLSSVCLQDSLFKKVVSTRKYKCQIKNIQMNTQREVEWENTNKLLRREGFLGIKTGITVTAGPCLASAYEFKNKTYIVVLLRALKISRRFKQTRKLLCWSLDKLYGKTLNQEEKKILQKLKRNNPDLDSDNSEDEQIFKYDIASEAQFKKRANIICYEM